LEKKLFFEIIGERQEIGAVAAAASSPAASRARERGARRRGVSGLAAWLALVQQQPASQPEERDEGVI
jgi:hypothetical protein